ncbi:MAG: hypothetical protein FWD78_17030 [Treponema sp.]|nr:hypothetical protein [Treponema sp.]
MKTIKGRKFSGLPDRFLDLLRGNPLKAASLLGLLLVIITAWALLFYTMTRNQDFFPKETTADFGRDLTRYDEAVISENSDKLAKRLDKLENQAKTQDDWLSILKRRRILAGPDRNQLAAYQKSAAKAANIFPYSEVLAAVAGEALLKGGETSPVLLNEYAGRITQPRFYPLALSFYVLAGNLDDPQKAAQITGLRRLFAADLPQELKGTVQTDDILLGIINKEQDSAIRISEAIRLNPNSAKLINLGAGYFYNYGNPMQAAGYYARLGDNYAEKTAAALAAAKEIPAARNIWTAMANNPGEEPELLIKSFYNLAATSADNREAAAWLEKIFTLGAGSSTGPNKDANISALIRYSRLQSSDRGIALLEGQDVTNEALLDLELLRRRLEILPVDSGAAQVWLLLGRHPQSQQLYQWGAWFFDRQKLYTETAQLLKIAGRQGFTDPWVNIHYGLSLLKDGRIDEGYKLLQAEYQRNILQDWRIPADMAAVNEYRRSLSAALELYQAAAALAVNPVDLSKIQFRLFRCLETLGKFDEGLKALEYAVELNPDDLNSAMELWRLESGR